MQKVINTIFIFLILINVAYVAAGVLFHPLQSMDAIGIWLLKAKAMYIEQGFPNAYLHNSEYSYSHQQYPLALPSLFFLFYQLMGGINEKILLLLYPLVYIGILIIAYTIMRKKTNTTCALIFTFIYSMLSPFVAGGGRILAGNADIFLVLIEWIIIFILYRQKRGYKDYILITFLVIIASQIKLEGVFFSAILLLLPLAKRMRFSLFAVSLIPFFMWSFIVYTLKIPADSHMIFPGVLLLGKRLIIIVLGIVRELFNINNWYLFWPLVLIAVFTKEKISAQMKQTLLPSYFVIMLLFVLVFLFTSIETYEYVKSSFDRILFQHSAIIFIFFFEKTHAIIEKYLTRGMQRHSDKPILL